jgi:hypothetical protein
MTENPRAVCRPAATVIREGFVRILREGGVFLERKAAEYIRKGERP